MGARLLFVTGTDTGVGKTFVACALIASARRLGLRVAAAKPLETGCARGAEGELVPADAVSLLKATGRDDPLDLICPYRFEQPLAPAYAAEAGGVTIDPAKILAALDALSEKTDLLIIEGAGGVLVPAWTKVDMVDLIGLAKAEALVVARTGLGTINHTRLTVEALRSRGIKIAGIVFNTTGAAGGRRTESPESRPPDPSEAENPRRAAELTGLLVWGVFDHEPSPVSDRARTDVELALSRWIAVAR